MKIDKGIDKIKFLEENKHLGVMEFMDRYTQKYSDDILGTYKNGNYNLIIEKDGSKYRLMEDDQTHFQPRYSESCDIKITNYCDMGCEYCHEGSSRKGLHGEDILDEEFLNSLRPYTELAIGGGDITTHSDFINFLIELRNRKVIANVTVNQKHFLEKRELIDRLIEERLINGIGVSLTNSNDKDFLGIIKEYENAVIHVIAGLFTEEDIKNLSDKDLKILILGYKELRRGKDYIKDNREYIEANITYLKDKLPHILDKFALVSFDNLSIRQLDVKNMFLQDKSLGEWDEFYMGDDAEFTFYIDLINKEFAKSSTSEERHPFIPNIDEMFEIIKERGQK